ncbi:MAG: 5'-deoxynucleotidase [Ruminococcaceae bacterium]|nr:5'-deoxynucleotidase [Oscillospiraceae bacterium]
MKSNYYAVLSRMKNIYRWGLMRNTRNESLSEHSFEVAVIAHALAVINNKRLGGNFNAEHCATVALFHDTSEIITGDMPTPVKYYNMEIRDAYKKIEKIADEKLISMLPEDMKDEFLGLYNPDEQTEKIVKAADRISALIKCIEETEMGNKEFAAAKKSIEKSVKELKMPEVDIFLKEFIDGFKLTLDEQN